MKEEIILAGFGGQGIMLMGKLISYAGMKEGKEVSWMPSYGPEMRGGTANCTVIVSDKLIPSPMTTQPDSIIVMNLPSFDKFLPQVKSGGTVFLNSTLIEEDVKRDDIKVIKIPANEIANQLGNSKIANMVMLGSYIENKDVIKLKTVKNSLESVLSARNQDLIDLNLKALEKGKEYK
ncbi:MAG: 2-oxoacid:acceptor oxidoreductase family protein [Halanaerobiales bacterium]|nr:2-oxoacid:acceptor oxidoreductase family protein [Halanaerobiales bacterium]